MSEKEIAPNYYLDEDGLIWDDNRCRYLEEDEKDTYFRNWDIVANRLFYEK